MKTNELNAVTKLADGRVEILFSKLLRRLPLKVLLILGNRRLNEVMVDRHSNRIIGVRCHPRDWEDILRSYASKSRRNDLIKQFRQIDKVLYGQGIQRQPDATRPAQLWKT